MINTKTTLKTLIDFLVYWFAGDNLAELIMTITYATVKPFVAAYVGGTIVKDYLTGLGIEWNWKQLTTYSQQLRKQKITTNF